MKVGLLLNNIGTPRSARPEDVKVYLDEFLMDPDVISLPRPLRWLLVKGLITPRRSHASAEKYAKIWTDRGSPLMFQTEDLATKLREVLGADWVVEIGMRYGQPSIQEGLSRLRQAGVEKIIFAPLFPQWSEATTASANKAFLAALKAMNWSPPIRLWPAFFDEKYFLEPLERQLQGRDLSDRFVLFSFHGLPESQVKKGPGCLQSENCCVAAGACEKPCYRAQCLKGAQALARARGLQEGRWGVGFQSRLGPARWIGPATDDVVASLVSRGFTKLTVLCPSFVSDCLETLEEIGIGLKEDFLRSGGEDFELLPCLNAEETWVKGFAEALRRERSSS